MKKIKGVLVTPNQKETKPRVYELKVNSYKDYYPLLECDTFDIQERKFGDHWLDIYCDDEGLFKEDNKPAIVTLQPGKGVVETIVGNVFIVGHNDEGETISLTDEQIETVLSWVREIKFKGLEHPLTVCLAEV